MIQILNETSKDPITLIGKMSGVCYGSNTADNVKNYKRGIDCLENNHGRTLEMAEVYMILDGYSAKTMREFYTHIGGAPTRLQASTRYIDYAKKGLPYTTPHSVEKNEEANKIYNDTIENILKAAQQLEEMGITKEDASMLFPLAMHTKVVCKMNLRTLISMANQRLCNRAFWEYRVLMKDLMKALSDYSSEWKEIIDTYFKPKCEVMGYCPEKFTCGRVPPKDLTGEQKDAKEKK